MEGPGSGEREGILQECWFTQRLTFGFDFHAECDPTLPVFSVKVRKEKTMHPWLPSSRWITA